MSKVTKKMRSLLIPLGVALGLLAVLLFGLNAISLADPAAQAGTLIVKPAVAAQESAPVAPAAPQAQPQGKSDIGDYVWHDANADGNYGAGEGQYTAGFSGVLINLYEDLNLNGTLDLAELGTLTTTLTGDNPGTPAIETGWYLFNATGDGRGYFVQVDPSNFLPGKPLNGYALTSGNTYQTTPNLSNSIYVYLGGLIDQNLNADFGFARTAVQIGKTPVFQYAAYGATVTFTMRVTNTGETQLRNIAVTDTLAIASSCNRTGLGPLDPNQSLSYQCTVVNVTYDFTNTANVSGVPYDRTSPGDPAPGEPAIATSNPAVVDVVNPQIAIAKTPDLQYALSGATVTFTIRVTNTGDVRLNNVSVTDALAPSCVRANLGALTPGQSTSYTCTASYTSDTTNSATTTGQPADSSGNPLPANIPAPTATDTGAVDIVAPAIAIAKTPDLQYALSGATVTFTIRVTNTGDVRLNNVSVTDALAPSCVRANLGALTPGQSTSYTCTASYTGDTTNSATTTGQPADSSGNPLPANIPAPTATDTGAVDIVAPAIAIAKTPDLQYALSGATVTFTIWVTNTGDVRLNNVSVTDALASSCVRANLGALTPGQSTSYTCTASYTSDTTNSATTTGQPADSSGNALPANIPAPTATDTGAVDIVAPAIAIAKTPDLQYALSGAMVTFTIRVTNTGDVRLNNVSVTDALAPSCVRANLGPLTPGQSTSYTCTATYASDTTNLASTTGQPADSSGNPLPANIPSPTASDTGSVDIVNPQIAIAKTPDLQQVGAGALVSFRIYVTNTGDVRLNSVVITDTLAPDCSRLGANNLGTLNPGVGTSYQCSVIVNSSLTNVAQTSGQPADGSGNSLPPNIPAPTAQDDAVVQVLTQGIDLVKTAGNAADGQTLTLTQPAPVSVIYTYVITNTGTSYLSNIAVTDDKIGAICTVVGPLGPGLSTTCTKTTSVTQDVTNTGTATGTPTNAAGTPIVGLTNPTDTDQAKVEFRGRIGDFVWWDVDGDGVQDAGEPGLPIVTVILTNSLGVTTTTTTDANGVYSFTNLLVGNYTVGIPSALPGGELAGRGWYPTSPANASTAVSLGYGQTITTVDFGLNIPTTYTLTKVSNQIAPARPGDPISFTIRITNTGRTMITKLPLRDVYSTTYLSFASASIATPPPNNTDDGQIDWPDLTSSFGLALAPNNAFSLIVTFTAKADTTLLPGSRITNTAEAHDAVAQYYLSDAGGASDDDPKILLPNKNGLAPAEIIAPTGLTVASFGATVKGNGVTLAWQTANESQILGFNMLRKMPSGDLKAVNDDLIIAGQSGTNVGAAYTYADSSLALGAYTYVLEVVKLNGTVERLKRATVTIQP